MASGLLVRLSTNTSRGMPVGERKREERANWDLPLMMDLQSRTVSCEAVLAYFCEFALRRPRHQGGVPLAVRQSPMQDAAL